MKRRKQILLELTPLLDVILIMLFYILMQSTQAADARQEEADREIGAMQEQMAAVSAGAEAAAAEAESREQELTDSLTYAQEVLYGYEAFDAYAQILTIYVSNGKDGARTIHVSDGTEDMQVSYDWDNMRYGRNGFKEILTEKISQSGEEMPVFAVFHYNDAQIYRQDYQLVTEVLGETAEGQPHVYIRYISEKEE